MKLITPLLIASLLAACGPGAQPASTAAAAPAQSAHSAEPGAAQASFDREKDALYWAFMDHSPGWAVGLGYHQYDGKLPDVSAAGIAARVAMLEQAEATLTAIPAAELSRISQIEREVLLAHVRKQRFELQVRESHKKNPMFYLYMFGLMDYISRDYAPLAERARGVIGVCSGAGNVVDQATANLQSVMPRTWIETALLQVNGLIEFTGNDMVAATAGLDQPLAGQLTQALGQCSTAFQAYKAFLQERLKQASDDYALGEETFLRMLREQEGVDTTIERLLAIGQADFDRNLRAMAEAAARVAPGKTVRQAIDLVSADKPEAGELVTVASKQADEMRRFLIDQQIVSIPSEDAAEVRESPPFMRWNSAFLSAAGSFEQKALPSFYYISPPDPSWPAEVQKGYIPFANDLLFTTIHELWPGHFLHSLHKKKNPSRILKTFCSYSMTEGWAHYTEEMMRDAGVGNGDPAVHMGQLMNALLRNARYMSALGLHARGMTVDESIALFRDKAYADQGTARQQAVRGTFDPGYLNYTLGKLMILELRDDWKEKKGDAYSAREFHDELLSYGCAPLPVIRRFMLGDDAGPAL